MPSLFVFRQTSRHDRILAALSATNEMPSVNILSDTEGGAYPAEAALPVAPPDGDTRSPRERWHHVRAAVAATLSPGDTLLVFQDQHLHAQAAVAAARGQGASVHLLQDGFLEFDLSGVGQGRAGTLWPVIRPFYGSGTPWSRWRHHVQMRVLDRHFFGHTRPDHAYVFGAVMQEQLARRFSIPLRRISVTGPVGLPPFDPLPCRKLPSGSAVRVLFLDQPFLLFGRMPADAFGKEYLGLLDALRRFDLAIKLHPATGDAGAAAVAARVGAQALVAHRGLLRPEDLSDIDVAVTVSSTAFLSVIGAGVPCVLVRLPSSVDRMPRIAHPLVRNCSTTDEAVAVLAAMAAGKPFAPNDDGRPLSDIVYEPGPAEPTAASTVARALRIAVAAPTEHTLS